MTIKLLAAVAFMAGYLRPVGRVVMDASAIDELRAQLCELVEDAQTIQNKADAEKRAMTEDEVRQFDAISQEVERIEADIERRERLAKMNDRGTQSRGRVVPPSQVDDAPRAAGSGLNVRDPSTISVVDRLPRGQWGWNHIGEFALAVRKAANPGGAQWDERLRRNAPTTVGQEGVGPDGGFVVPPDFRNDIMEKVTGETGLLSRTDQIPVAGNSFSMPVDETTPWQTSGGVQAYWEDELGQSTQSKPNFTTKQVRANRITALVGISEEMLEDAPAIDAYLRRKAPEKINFKVDSAIVSGNGVGKPLGILSSPSLVTVTKETSQAADTLFAENIYKMYSRLYAPLLGRAVWLMNQDVMPQLLALNSRTFNVAGSEVVAGGQPLYVGPGQIQAAPNGMLLGRPIIYTQACPTVGDLGDVIFGDLTQYLTIVKGGLKADVSMHLWFDYQVTAYRFVLRIGGTPWWASAITPASGSSNTLGCFVALQAR